MLQPIAFLRRPTISHSHSGRQYWTTAQ